MTPDTDHHADPTFGPPKDQLPAIDHITVENEDNPNECALFPASATEAELMTTWISAHEDSYVDLASTR